MLLRSSPQPPSRGLPEMTVETHDYRPDIDGLRALAILAVVFYHAGVPGFSGGFVGVDVFFVISGYLITSIIERNISRNRFSLAAFYERRVRRILPALFVMMGASAIAAAALLYPVEYRSFARSLITTTLFVSSVQFRREGGYFDVEADRKPLLHTWSLSVEEIFYVFFPVLLLLLWRCCRLRRFWIVGAFAALSFIGAVGALYLKSESRAAFFLAHFRAWELLIGVLLALAATPLPRYRRGLDLASLVGVAMIVAAVIGYSDATTFPGAAALLPCLGAALVILAGQHHRSLAGRILSRRPLVLTGLISYSLYLWHWPILVFAGAWLGRRPAGGETAALILASFVAAILSWRYVERPFRGKSGWLSRRTLFATAGAVGALLVAIGLHGEVTRGWLGRYPDALRVVLDADDDRDPRQKECLLRAQHIEGCVYGRPQAPPTIALWGDSHAAVYAPMLGAMADARGESVLALTLPACPPTAGWEDATRSPKARQSCARYQDMAITKILGMPSIRTVVVAANFGAYYREDNRDGRFAVGLERAIARLRHAGKQVVIVSPFPRFDAQILETLAKAAGRGEDLTAISQPLGDFLRDNRAAFNLLDSIGSEGNLLRIHPHAGLCDDRRCFVYGDGRAYYTDEDHLSMSGAAVLSPLFEPIFRP